jgi:hypothetical protein
MPQMSYWKNFRMEVMPNLDDASHGEIRIA